MRRRDRIYRPQNLRKLVRPTRVINQAINRGRDFASRLGRRAVKTAKLALQLAAAPFQHFGGAIQNLAAQIWAAFRPGRDCISGRAERIPKIFSRCSAVIGQHVSIRITCGDDAPIFTADEFSADEKLVGFLHRQPAPLFGHELRIARAAKKENAKRLLADETER